MFFIVYSLMWLSATLIGVVGFPLFFVTFHRLPDRGYSVARYGGMILVAYLSWLAAHLGVSFGTWLIGGVMLLFLAANLAIASRQWTALRRYVRENGRYLFAVETLFFVGLGVFLWLTGFNGAIDPDSERMMDMAMLQGVLKTSSFPQQDIWLSGFFVNYYYFGYVIVGILQKVTGLALPYFFNGAVALIYALVLIGAYGCGYNFTRRHRYGALAVGMVLFFGNINALVQLTSGTPFAALDWFGCSRVIPGTINEFPWFSFLWGDLHPYMLAFPIVFIVFAFALNHLFECAPPDGSGGPRPRANRLLQVVLWAILGGSLIAVNTWDYPAYFVVLLLAMCVGPLFAPTGRRVRRLLSSLGLAAVYFMAGIFAYFPYLRVFQQHRSIRLVSEGRSLFTDFLQLFGLFILPILVYWLMVVVRTPSTSKRQGKSVLIMFVFVTAISLFRQTAYLYFVALACLAAGTLWVLFDEVWSRKASDEKSASWSAPSSISFFVIAMTALPWLYALVCEFLYVNDLYTGLLERQNTVFKVYLQIWFIWAMGGVFTIYLIGETLKRSPHWYARWGFRVALFLLLLAGLVYPVAGTWARTRGFAQRFTLDGMAFNRVLHPADCRAIDWMNTHITGRPVVLEAPGYAYCWNGRISTFTGLPGVMGWFNHEAGWRDSYEEVLKRRNDMDQIYRTTAADRALQLMDVYNVEYVVIGPPEREEYADHGLRKFEEIMDCVYSASGVSIYRRMPFPDAPAAPAVNQ
ncbi:MAG: hypothetical protein EOM20_02120 [Spartobacteria bacterium]|nr:hypothetical protein [Spartobacteria bacterium]